MDPKTYRLWTGDVPGAFGKADADIPTLTDYGVPGAKPMAGCVVCPGGGYSGLADHEGRPIAEWMGRLGIRALVLKYRLGPKYHHPVMMEDAERAVRYLRANAEGLGIDATRVGIIGFSAGGHLASTICTHNTSGDSNSVDLVERQSSRPDWSILVYPVIEMEGPYAHAGSRENLLGKTPAEKDMTDLSNQLAVSLTTPPAFLVHGADDIVVPVQNSLDYAKALADHKVPFELHVPQDGPHGFGLGKVGTAQDWTGPCEMWLRGRGLL